MPTYVYKFTDTGETIEVHQAFTDDALAEFPHPSDGALRPVKKVFQPVGVTFKGGGFYKTDSRGGSSSSGAASPASPSDSSSASSSDSSASTSSDSSSASSSDSSASTSATTSGSTAAPSTPA
ncbi:MAG: FmdB family transcriptional regulator [Actinobacteria bacterium]|nr:FmdB family transcriptional regulator [Actinomycetota bacterium]